MVTAANMPTAIDTLTSDVVVLPTYHAQRNASQLTPFEALGSIQPRSQGTPGSFGGLAIRGNALQDTLVLIDGFRVSPSSGADFSLLPMAYGSRTEILRGPGSGVYGQNAGGGVVQYLSDRAGPKTRVSGEAGIGGRGYMQMRGRVSGGNEQITGTLDVGRERGDGFDATARDYPGHQDDQDSWKRDNLSGRLDARLSTATNVTFVAMRNTVNADFDGTYGGNTALAAKKRLELTGVRADHQLSPNTRLDAKFGQSSISNTWNYTNNVATWDKTRLREYGLGATQQVTPEVLARVGAERLEESYDTTGLSSPTRTTHALTGNAVGEYGPHQLNVALRLDDSNRYKKTFSHQVGYGYRLADNLRVVGNLNTGYRMPDLADYYASPENARLKQQRNQTVDAGAYWQPDQATYAKAIVYRSRLRDRLTCQLRHHQRRPCHHHRHRPLPRPGKRPRPARRRTALAGKPRPGQSQEQRHRPRAAARRQAHLQRPGGLQLRRVQRGRRRGAEQPPLLRRSQPAARRWRPARQPAFVLARLPRADGPRRRLQPRQPQQRQLALLQPAAAHRDAGRVVLAAVSKATVDGAVSNDGPLGHRAGSFSHEGAGPVHLQPVGCRIHAYRPGA